MAGFISSSADPHVMEFTGEYLPVLVSFAVVFFVLMHWAFPRLSAKYVSTYNQLSYFDKADWNTRIMSSLHCVIVSILSVYLLLTDETVNADKLWGSSHLARVNICIICGFLLADLVYMAIWFPLNESYIYYIHHFFVLYPFFYNIIYGPLTFFANFRITTECSTLFVNMRWFLATLDLKTSNLYVLNGLMLTVMFFLCRIAVIPIYYATVYEVVGRATAALPWTFIVAWLPSGMVMDALNVFWFRKIFQGATKTLLTRKRQKGVTVRNRVKGE